MVDFPEPIFPSILTIMGCGYGCGAYGIDVVEEGEAQEEAEAEADEEDSRDIMCMYVLYYTII